MLTLSPEHIYKLDDKTVPGVTSVISEFIPFSYRGEDLYLHTLTGSVITKEIMDNASEIGSAIHKGMFYLLTGQGLNWDSLNPVLKPALKQGEQWIKDYSPQWELCEKSLYSNRYDYAGTLDFFGVVQGLKKGHKALIDHATGMYGGKGQQTAAYETLVREETGFRGIIDRFVLQLPRDGGDYKFVPMTDKTDFQRFLMKLQLKRMERK
jgi:hypothetical protein